MSALIFVILASVSGVEGASVKKINIGNAETDSENAINVDNDNAPDFVKKPKKYSISKKYAKTKGFEKTKNKIKTKKGNKKYVYITKYFLPSSWKVSKKTKDKEYWYNCQSIVVKGKYMYILTSSGHNLNKGFIIRYDTKLLKKYKVETKKGLSSLRHLGADMRDGKNLTKNQKKLLKAIKIGPVFTVGHGQSLAYNKKSKSLWMWQDNNSKSTLFKLMRINMKTLKPNLVYKFTITYKNKKLKQVHNLAFDENGNFYFNKKYNNQKSERIFKGSIKNNKVSIDLLALIKNSPGTYAQSLAINHANKRLYLVSDGVFYSMPLKKLCEGTLTANDFYYTVFDTKREFEGISFDSKGRSYLLILRGTEVLISNQI